MSLKPPILTVGKFDFYSVTQHGITFNQETPRAEWLDVMKRLMQFHDYAVMSRERTLMLMADALNFGENAYGEEFAQAIDNTRAALGLSVKTIQNAKWVYGKVDVSLRREGLTLNHYSLLAALPENDQKVFIDVALKENFSVKELRDKVAETHPKTTREKTRKTSSLVDDEKTALQKLIDAGRYAQSVDINDLGSAWKPHAEVWYKIYRRRWLNKKKK